MKQERIEASARSALSVEDTLKLALEALENAQHFIEEYAASKYIHFHNNTITAIKEALMSFQDVAPQSNPLVIDSDEKASSHMEKSLWEFIDTASMFPRAKPDPRTWPHVMVFAPQRKPLTFEQVEDCFPDGYSTEDNGILVSAQWLHDYARAIEAAHGIYAPTELKE